MGFAVVNGAMCRCPFGAAPCTLVIAPSAQVMMNNMPVGTIMDYTPTNITGFGMCSSMANPAVSAATAAALGVLTPQPCTPAIAAPWMPGSPTVLLGQNPVLTDNSKAICMFGGVIEIVNASQATVKVP